MRILVFRRLSTRRKKLLPDDLISDDFLYTRYDEKTSQNAFLFFRETILFCFLLNPPIIATGL